LGWVARGFLKINKVVKIAIIILLPLLFFGATFFKVYSYQVQELTVQKCEALNTYAQIDCYNQLARRENNWAICEQINGADNIREDCLNTIWAKNPIIEPNNCGILSGHQKTECYWDVAVKKNDQTICNNIDESQQLKDNCVNWVKQNGPAEVGDIGACLKLGGSEPNTNYPEVRTCIYRVIEKANGDPSLCVIVPNNLLDRDNCYTHAATIKKDLSICKNTVGTYAYNYCVKEVNSATK